MDTWKSSPTRPPCAMQRLGAGRTEKRHVAKRGERGVVIGKTGDWVLRNAVVVFREEGRGEGGAGSHSDNQVDLQVQVSRTSHESETLSALFCRSVQLIRWSAGLRYELFFRCFMIVFLLLYRWLLVYSVTRITNKNNNTNHKQ